MFSNHFTEPSSLIDSTTNRKSTIAQYHQS